MKNGDDINKSTKLDEKREELKKLLQKHNLTGGLHGIEKMNQDQILESFLIFQKMMSGNNSKNKNDNELTELILKSDAYQKCKMQEKSKNELKSRINVSKSVDQNNNQTNFNDQKKKDIDQDNEKDKKLKEEWQRPNTKCQGKKISKIKPKTPQCVQQPKLEINLSPTNTRYYNKSKRIAISPIDKTDDGMLSTPQSHNLIGIVSSGNNQLDNPGKATPDCKLKTNYLSNLKKRKGNNNIAKLETKKKAETSDNHCKKKEEIHKDNKFKKPKNIMMQPDNLKFKETTTAMSKKTPSSIRTIKKLNEYLEYNSEPKSENDTKSLKNLRKTNSYSQINLNLVSSESMCDIGLLRGSYDEKTIKVNHEQYSNSGQYISPKERSLSPSNEERLQLSNDNKTKPNNPQDTLWIESDIKTLKVTSPKVMSSSNRADEENYLSDNPNDLKEFNLQQYSTPRGELTYMINEHVQGEEMINKKLYELNREIGRLKVENNRVSKLREEYEVLIQKLQKDLKENNKKKEEDIAVFNAYKEEEIKKFQKEKKQFAHELQVFNDNKMKNKIIPSLSKKDKEIIEQLKTQISKMQEDSKFKENSSKMVIDRYKKQLEEANILINELSTDLLKFKQSRQLHNSYSQVSPFKNSKSMKYKSRAMNMSKQTISIDQTNQHQAKKGTSSSISNVTLNLQPRKMPSFLNKKIEMSKDGEEEEEELDDTFDIIFPEKYHKTEFNLIKQETSNEGKITRLYDNDKKEIIFPSGSRKESYGDGYQIIYFSNGDVKQMYPNGKIVYYFSEAKTIQTTFKSHQVFKFENGQIEKHFKDGTKQIAFLDGSLKYILPDGSEETFFLDGRIHKINNKGILSIENEEGLKEIHYPEENEPSDNRKNK